MLELLATLEIMFLSFIIPIYNCETYIKECLGIIFQSKLSVDEFEVILVDDGSTDTSAEICRAYTEKYSNIRYYVQKNQGPATARNLGLEQAKGDYVWFVDADDAIHPCMPEKLKKQIVEHPKVDLISFAYVEQYPQKEVLKKLVDAQEECSGLEFLERKGGGFLWNNIYRREAVGNHRFLDGVRHIEDYCFNVQTIVDFNRVFILPEVGYSYNRKNLHSISHDKRLRDRVKANDDSFRVYNALYQTMQETTDERKKAYLVRELHFSVAAHLYTMARFDNVRTIRKYIAAYRGMGLYPLKKTGNRKSDLFILLANHERLFLSLIKALKIVKRPDNGKK